jgi:hypothetical protein
LGTTVTNQNSIHEEIKIRINLGNASSVQNLLSPGLLSKTKKIKIYQTIILTLVLYGCETWSMTFRKKHRPQRDEIIGQRKLPKEELH